MSERLKELTPLWSKVNNQQAYAEIIKKRLGDEVKDDHETFVSKLRSIEKQLNLLFRSKHTYATTEAINEIKGSITGISVHDVKECETIYSELFLFIGLYTVTELAICAIDDNLFFSCFHLFSLLALVYSLVISFLVIIRILKDNRKRALLFFSGCLIASFIIVRCFPDVGSLFYGNGFMRCSAELLPFFPYLICLIDFIIEELHSVAVIFIKWHLSRKYEACLGDFSLAYYSSEVKKIHTGTDMFD